MLAFLQLLDPKPLASFPQRPQIGDLDVLNAHCMTVEVELVLHGEPLEGE